jgi:small subunit ribosomal protein S8
MMTDPIADMLTRIRNANVAMHDQVRMPSSKQKVALATTRPVRAACSR